MIDHDTSPHAAPPLIRFSSLDLRTPFRLSVTHSRKSRFPIPQALHLSNRSPFSLAPFPSAHVSVVSTFLSSAFTAARHVSATASLVRLLVLSPASRGRQRSSLTHLADAPVEVAADARAGRRAQLVKVGASAAEDAVEDAVGSLEPLVVLVARLAREALRRQSILCTAIFIREERYRELLVRDGSWQWA